LNKLRDRDKLLIFDASSAYVLIKEGNLKGLRTSTTLDLAFYEIGNSVIQELRMKIIDEKAARVYFEVLETLPQIMNMASTREFGSGMVFEVAEKLHLTFYDASYVTLAQEKKESLVTEDSYLAKAARKMGVEVYSSTNYGDPM
jgi:predicted nucleic acid-binding protein